MPLPYLYFYTFDYSVLIIIALSTINKLFLNFRISIFPCALRGLLYSITLLLHVTWYNDVRNEE